MIIFTPADLPRVEPDDWDTFWEIWNTHKRPLVKKIMNSEYSDKPIGDDSVWVGLDIFKGALAEHFPVSYEAPFYDIRKKLPKLYKLLSSIDKLGIVARLSQSSGDVTPHTDNAKDKWHLRAYFHYTDPVQQWYFTKPFDTTKRKYINLPKETNWFMYNDLYAWHGTDFNPNVNHKKILLQYYSLNSHHMLAKRSIEKYGSFAIQYKELL